VRLTRRHFLAASGLVAAGAALAAGGVAASWWDTPADAPLHVLSEEEADILDALAEAIYPEGGDPGIGGRRARCGRACDTVMRGLVPTQAKLLKLAIHALDALPVPTHGRRLRYLPTPAATDAVRSWLRSDLAELRGVVQSLAIFVGTAWTLHPEVQPRIAAMTRCGYGPAEGSTPA
jgi:hypothetical protein